MVQSEEPEGEGSATACRVGGGQPAAPAPVSAFHQAEAVGGRQAAAAGAGQEGLETACQGPMSGAAATTERRVGQKEVQESTGGEEEPAVALEEPLQLQHSGDSQGEGADGCKGKAAKLAAAEALRDSGSAAGDSDADDVASSQSAALDDSRPASTSGAPATPPLHSAPYKVSLCKFWNKDGGCAHGVRCTFAHGEHELRHPASSSRTGGPAAAAAVAAAVLTGSPAAKPHLLKTQLCRHFMRRGTCAHGSRCAFAHGEHELRKLAVEERRVCTFWLEGNCKNGSTCRFLHSHPEQQSQSQGQGYSSSISSDGELQQQWAVHGMAAAAAHQQQQQQQQHQWPSHGSPPLPPAQQQQQHMHMAAAHAPQHVMLAPPGMMLATPHMMHGWPHMVVPVPTHSMPQHAPPAPSPQQPELEKTVSDASITLLLRDTHPPFERSTSLGLTSWHDAAGDGSGSGSGSSGAPEARQTNAAAALPMPLPLPVAGQAGGSQAPLPQQLPQPSAAPHPQPASPAPVAAAAAEIAAASPTSGAPSPRLQNPPQPVSPQAPVAVTATPELVGSLGARSSTPGCLPSPSPSPTPTPTSAACDMSGGASSGAAGGSGGCSASASGAAGISADMRSLLQRRLASLLCPLTGEPFQDPVLAADGMLYERRAIEAWLYKDGCDISPITRKPLPHKMVMPCAAILRCTEEVMALISAMRQQVL